MEMEPTINEKQIEEVLNQDHEWVLQQITDYYSRADN